jgi:hypothetical protein
VINKGVDSLVLKSTIEIISKNIPSVSAPETEEDLVIKIFIGK